MIALRCTNNFNQLFVFLLTCPLMTSLTVKIMKSVNSFFSQFGLHKNNNPHTLLTKEINNLTQNIATKDDFIASAKRK